MTVASVSDYIRCDMAFLILNDQIAQVFHFLITLEMKYLLVLIDLMI